ncbi:hypothetical protein Patl1_19447 [Pistacia atlantica]|uniref:Uncharacterized protein n=1 Tax=Pistacia atlantica TaxID=434234 RepID=A0ACC1C1G4_9ROSI|nr:hypothetical protein Patl1_19447 [Pistacia atlantica]
MDEDMYSKVNMSVDQLMEKSWKDYRYELHQYFKKFKSTEEARQHPYRNVTKDDWDGLCTFFENKYFERRPRKDSNARAQLPYDHRAGLKSSLRYGGQWEKLFHNKHCAAASHEEMEELRETNEGLREENEELCEEIDQLREANDGLRDEADELHEETEELREEIEGLHAAAQSKEEEKDRINRLEEKMKRLEEVVSEVRKGFPHSHSMPSLS